MRVTHSRTGRDIYTNALAKSIGTALVDPRIERVFKLKVRKVKPKVNADGGAQDRRHGHHDQAVGVHAAAVQEPEGRQDL